MYSTTVCEVVCSSVVGIFVIEGDHVPRSWPVVIAVSYITKIFNPLKTDLHAIHPFPYAFNIQWQISLTLPFTAVTNCKKARWHCLEASIMWTITFNVRLRYNTRIWLDLTILYDLQFSTPSKRACAFIFLFERRS